MRLCSQHFQTFESGIRIAIEGLAVGLRKEDMTLRIQRAAIDGLVVFSLSGRIQMEDVAELQNLFSHESSDQRVALDLAEVRLVDREAVEFLTQCEAAGVGLKSCPPYIREWIRKEREQG